MMAGNKAAKTFEMGETLSYQSPSHGERIPHAPAKSATVLREELAQLEVVVVGKVPE